MGKENHYMAWDKEGDEIEVPFPKPLKEAVNHPEHYQHPSGVECIDVAEHMPFNLGNALKYIWRCEDKSNTVEDLKKAKWYLEREINKREEQA